MYSKVLAALLIGAVLLQQTTAASAPAPQASQATEEQDTPEALAALEARLAENDEIDERAVNFLNVKNWNEKTIDNKYDPDDLPALAYALDQIYTGNAASFKKMVRLQLYLYQKFEDEGDDNDKYTFNVAYYFLKMKKDKQYSNLSSDLKSKLNEYISYLPPSLDFFFFQPSFCLLNRKYLQYVYATETPIDSQRDHIFVFKSNNINANQRPWMTKVSDVSTNRQTKLKITLKQNKSKRVAYLERGNYGGKKNLVAAWHSSFQEPDNYEWNVSLYQNQLIFSQNGRVICASGSTYDQNRRYVQGVAGNGLNAPECQWYAKRCP
ncbi:uncharacterized protein LOC101448948 [Ceratitis capitata]|uniref:(Mediterranean fruit fly) hypothetical protein n=1 Tax=Ceratitis capitata TaxID=7213 RepID=A0A811V995_CERCA|nr:uncharacterized protein LOC101448948 [Ceratitis capitata]CAD7012788.1 unnamed protein product [Ceratitis capitata]